MTPRVHLYGTDEMARFAGCKPQNLRRNHSMPPETHELSGRRGWTESVARKWCEANGYTFVRHETGD